MHLLPGIHLTNLTKISKPVEKIGRGGVKYNILHDHYNSLYLYYTLSHV